MNYLLIGEDELSKDVYIAKVKDYAFKKEFNSFNFDSFYAKDIKDKRVLQEACLRLPHRASKRIILIRNIERLSKSVQGYLRNYLKYPFGHVILILETKKDFKALQVFLNERQKFLKIVRFKKKYVVTGIDLNKAIEQRRPQQAIRFLWELLADGQKPHFILGGIIGYFKKRSYFTDTKRYSLVLGCILKTDLEIKTGRLKPEYALEKLIVQLCLI